MKGKMECAFEQLLRSAGKISHTTLRYPTVDVIAACDLRFEIEDVYRRLGGNLPSLPLNLRPWDMELDGIAVELDEFLHFNRFRGMTLESAIYDCLPRFPLIAYECYCSEHEDECLSTPWCKSGYVIGEKSAVLILLEKDPMVLEGGVIEGRKVFANILKYIRMGASSNFGNMFSVLGASAILPFLPMAPIQILTNNMLYDFSQVPIPNDTVDDEQVARPRPWNIGEIRRFILCVGPISSIFDYTTFFVMLYLFKCWDPSRASLFQTGWFVESVMTQTLVIHIIRTNKIPFFQSRASWPLLITTLTIMAFGAWLPYSPLASSLGLTHLPTMYWPILLLTLLAYTGLTQGVKVWLLRMKWI